MFDVGTEVSAEVSALGEGFREAKAHVNTQAVATACEELVGSRIMIECFEARPACALYKVPDLGKSEMTSKGLELAVGLGERKLAGEKVRSFQIFLRKCVLEGDGTSGCR